MNVPGEKLLIKLWESIADKGIGNLLRPWQIRRDGRATIDVKKLELLEMAQAEREAAAIRAGRLILLNSGVLIDAPKLLGRDSADQPQQGEQVLQPLLETAAHNHAADTVRREINVTKAVLAAEADLASDPTLPPEDLASDDWLYRWRDHASSISSEDMTALWGRVLAGEVRAPGRYSLRTMEFLKSLNHNEARLIEKIAPFVVQSMIPLLTPEVEKSHGVRIADLLELQELGLLAGVDSVGLNMSWATEIDTGSGFQRLLRARGRALLVQHSEKSKMLALGGYMLTTIGREVFQLAEAPVNESWLREVGRKVKEQGFNVQIGDIQKLEGGRARAVALEEI